MDVAIKLTFCQNKRILSSVIDAIPLSSHYLDYLIKETVFIVTVDVVIGHGEEFL